MSYKVGYHSGRSELKSNFTEEEIYLMIETSYIEGMNKGLTYYENNQSAPDHPILPN
jgi:hypothetical protein